MAWGDDNGKGRNPWGSVPPSGGGRGNGGPPPEFDDLIGRFQDRMKNLMPDFLKGRGIFVVLALFVFVWLASGFYRVQPSEQGVELRFGKWTETTTQGWQYHLPYPIETVFVLNVTNVNRIDIGFRPGETQSSGGRASDILEESLMLTGDENIVNVSFTVFWVIDDAKNFLFNIQSPQAVTVKEIAESVMRETVGKTNFQGAITEARGPIQVEVLERLQDVLNSYGAGILITGIELSKVEAPPQVLTAFRDVQAAVQDNTRYQNEARAYANEIVPRAQGEAAKITQQAEAYKEQVIARATGEASRFLAVYEQYNKAKDVTRKRIYLETMEEILSGMNKVIVDEGAGTGVVPYLPLPELQSKRNEGGENE